VNSNLPVAGNQKALRWRMRFVLWLAATVAGLVVVMFSQLAALAQDWFRQVYAGNAWLPFVLMPTAGMVIVWLAKHWFPGSQGSGVPQVIAAVRLAAHGELTSALVSLRIAVGKIGLVVAGLGSGYSIGIEAPSVQVAASIIDAAYKYLPNFPERAIQRSELILAGGAAGIAAVFNAPIAGIMFALEILRRRQEEPQARGILLITVILAGLVSISLQGNYSYFGELHAGDVTRGIVLPVVACGIFCGGLGGVFSHLLLLPHRYPHWQMWRFRSTHPILFAGLCGLVVATIGWFSAGASFGNGYATTANAISGSALPSWQEPFTKFAATVVSYLSGIPGGTFAPALAIGAAIGFDAAPFVAGLASQHQMVALCMSAFLAAVTQAPITAAIIVVEMIDGHGMVLSLMCVALIAEAVGTYFGPELYQRLAQGYVKQPNSLEAEKTP
jgi:H+/Cl- antiporter ClcA